MKISLLSTNLVFELIYKLGVRNIFVRLFEDIYLLIVFN